MAKRVQITAADLAAQLLEFPPEMPVRIWVRGEGIIIDIEAVEQGAASPVVYLEVDLRGPNEQTH